MIYNLINYCNLAIYTDGEIEIDLGEFLIPRLSKQPPPNHLKIVKYLKNGTILENDIMAGGSSDYFDHSKFTGLYKEYSDGIWIWSTLITYYFENYNLILPIEFLENIKNNKWEPPRLSQVQCKLIVDSFQVESAIDWIS